jgi:hypothetical protein
MPRGELQVDGMADIDDVTRQMRRRWWLPRALNRIRRRTD